MIGTSRSRLTPWAALLLQSKAGAAGDPPPLPQNLKRTFQKLAPNARAGHPIANLDYNRMTYDGHSLQSPALSEMLSPDAHNHD
jgi:hypothetical protein